MLPATSLWPAFVGEKWARRNGSNILPARRKGAARARPSTAKNCFIGLRICLDHHELNSGALGADSYIPFREFSSFAAAINRPMSRRLRGSGLISTDGWLTNTLNRPVAESVILSA